MNLGLLTDYHFYHRYFTELRQKGYARKTKSFAWLSLTIFTICFFAIIAIRPTLVTIASLNQEIKEKKDASLKLQSKINAIILAQQEYATNVDNIYLLSEAMPEKNQFPALIYFFEQIAASSQVQLQSLSMSKIGEENNSTKIKTNVAKTLDFSVGATGDYLLLKDFLKKIENSSRVISVQRASFNQIKKDDVTSVSLIISGNAFFEK